MVFCAAVGMICVARGAAGGSAHSVHCGAGYVICGDRGALCRIETP